MGILVELTPYDPVAAAAVTLRATDTDDSRVCALNGQGWFPVIAEVGSFALDLFSASFPGFAETPTGSLSLSLEAYPLMPRFSWADRPAKLWIGEAGDAWPWTLFFEGLISSAECRDGQMKIELRVDDAWLDKPVLSSLYAGTGAAEGPAALKGAPKPLCLGAPKFVPLQLLDAVKQIYQLHGYGSVQAVTVLMDRLVRYGTSAGNDASYAALDAATVAAGSWRTCNALGLVRFGAPPVGPATAFVEGDNGTADGWVRKPGAIIKRLALLAGATTGQLDLTNLTALDTAVSRNLSLFRGSQVTAREMIGAVAASCNGLAMVDFLGKLRVVRPSLASPALTLAADGTAEPQILDPELLENATPFWRTQMEADRAWRVHASGEFNRFDFADLVGATKPADNATVGAPAGTLVAGVPAEDVAAGIAGSAPQVVVATIGTSATITKLIPNGATATVEASLVLSGTSGTGTVTLNFAAEFRVAGGSYGTVSGASGADSGTVGDSLSIQVSGSVTNSSGQDQVYEFRAVGTISAGDSGTVNQSISFLRV